MGATPLPFPGDDADFLTGNGTGPEPGQEQLNMAVDRAKWRKLSDLYVEGTVVELRGDVQIWLQALNPFEQSECRTAARAARARTLAALQADDSPEMAMALLEYQEGGRDKTITRLVNERYGEFLLNAQNELEADPDWTERLELIDRAEELRAEPPTEEEEAAVREANQQYIQAIQTSVDSQAKNAEVVYQTLSDEDLAEEVRKRYLERRANEAAAAEYALTEVWLAARICDATRRDDGTWEHHIPVEGRERVWETKDEVRALPDELWKELRDALDKLNIARREAKGSGARVSSSASLPPSKQVAESTPSSQDETPAERPGTSTKPSATPSPS